MFLGKILIIILVPVAFIAGIIVSIIFLLAGIFILNTIVIHLVFFMNIAMILGRLLYGQSGISNNQVLPFNLPTYPYQQGIFPPQFAQFPQQLLSQFPQQLLSPYFNNLIPPPPSNHPQEGKNHANFQQSSTNPSDDMANIKNMEIELMDQLVKMMKNSENIDEALTTTDIPLEADIAESISRQGQSEVEINSMIMMENSQQHFRPLMMIDTVLKPPRLQ